MAQLVQQGASGAHHADQLMLLHLHSGQFSLHSKPCSLLQAGQKRLASLHGAHELCMHTVPSPAGSPCLRTWLMHAYRTVSALAWLQHEPRSFALHSHFVICHKSHLAQLFTN